MVFRLLRCVDHNGVYDFHVCFDLCVFYVEICVNVCGVVCVVCCLFLVSECCVVVGVWGVVILVLSVMHVIEAVH